jgi:CBS domain-containing protein
MDGGRVLRSFLSRVTEHARATRIAASVGQALAILLGFLGLFTNPFLLFIALFVYLGAQAEAQHAEMRSAFRGTNVRDAMITRFRALSPDDTLGIAADELLDGDQQDFPVLQDDRVIGILGRQHLLKGLATRGRDAPVGEAMFKECGQVDIDDALESTYTRMKELGCGALPVIEDGRLVGIISLDNISEWIMVQTALQEGKATEPRQLHPLIGGR